MRVKLFIILALIAYIVGVAVCLELYLYANQPLSVYEECRAVCIRPGNSFSDVAQMFQQEGLISDSEKFIWLARLCGEDTRVMAGEYCLSPGMSPKEILSTLVSGKVVLHKVVIPEGYNLQEISDILDAKGIVHREVFLKAATNSSLVKSMGLEGPTFEGYLFPDTYYFPKGTGAERVIKTMVTRFWAAFAPEWIQRAQTLGLSIHQVVTLASMVEKETAVPEERPLIAAVFHNRLKRGMRLECDPTVIYGIKGFDGNIRRVDLKKITPYNTYMISGLPPGPIASPGRASLEAVLYPAHRPYLYFVSRNDGTHKFSTTLSEHNRAVKRFQQQ
nr:endolytic transglycosylase MltG [Desulfobacterales bacterium]